MPNASKPAATVPTRTEARAINDALTDAYNAIMKARNLMTAAGIAGSNADRKRLGALADEIGGMDARVMDVTIPAA